MKWRKFINGIQKSSSPKPHGQIQPNLAKKHPWMNEMQVIQIRIIEFSKNELLYIFSRK